LDIKIGFDDIAEDLTVEVGGVLSVVRAAVKPDDAEDIEAVPCSAPGGTAVQFSLVEEALTVS
jgi:hypothetical protein